MDEGSDSRLDVNIAKTRKYMGRFVSATVPHFIAGEPVLSASGATFETLDPTTNERQCTVASGDQRDIDRAADAAARSFKPWAAISGQKRRAVLHDIADAIVARAEEIALIESTDTGQPIRYM